MNIRISRIIKDSVIDGPGKRYVIFVQGCYHNCIGCNNSQSLNPAEGKNMDTDEIFKDIEKIKDEIDGITFNGGEPFNQAEPLATLGRKIKNELNLNILTYTGYTFEELLNDVDKFNSLDWLRLLTISDYLIDGKYIENLKSDKYKFRGSTNQRFIDCKKSLSSKEAIEVEEYKYIESDKETDDNIHNLNE
jgi:anaerobic ribonucleoside-triphosphate reductase activating protein